MATDFASRGRELLAGGKPQEAVKVCRLGLLSRPTEVSGRLVLAQALLALRRYDEVLAEAKIALDVDANNGGVHRVRGEALLRKGDAIAAREALATAKRFDAGDPAIAALLAEAEVAALQNKGRPKAPEVGGETKHYPAARAGTEAKPLAKAESKDKDRTGSLSTGDLLEITSADGVIELAEDDSSVLVDAAPIRPGTRPPEGLRRFSDKDEATDLDDDPDGAATSTQDQDTVNAKPVKPAAALRAPAPAKRAPSEDFSFLSDEQATERTAPRRPKPPSAPPPAPFSAAPRPGRETMRGSPGARDLRPSRRLESAIADLLPEEDAATTMRASPLLDHPTQIGIPSAPSNQARPGPAMPSPIPPPPSPVTATIIDGGRNLAAVAPTIVVGVPPHLAPPPAPFVPDQAAPEPRGRRRRGLTIAIWLIAAVLVIGGGVVAGVVIRDVRLSRQIASARAEADRVSRSDSAGGWRMARDLWKSVVEAEDSPSTRGALARARAVLATEFGVDVEEALASGTELGTSPEERVARAYLLVAVGDETAAQTEAAVAATAAPKDSGAAFVVGRATLLAGKSQEAAVAFRSALRIEPRPLYYIGLAEAELASGHPAEARTHSLHALELAPGHPLATILRARALIHGGEPVAGLAEQLEGYLAEPTAGSEGAIAPGEAAWAGLALAELARAQGQPDKAKAALARVIDRGSWMPRFVVEAARLSIAIGDLETANELIDVGRKRFGKSTGLRGVAAELALARGDSAAALAELGEAIGSGGRPELLVLRARIQLALGKVELATQDLDVAIERAPQLEEAIVARAELDLVRDGARQAVNRLSPHYAASPSSRLVVVYARALREAGDTDQARSVLDKLLAAASTDAAGLTELGRLERDLGNFPAAEAALTRAAAASSEPMPKLELAWLAINRGNARAGRDTLDALVAVAPPDPDLLAEAARAHTLTGDLAGARALLDRATALAANPSAAVLREKGRLALRERDGAAAAQALAQAVELAPRDGETRVSLIEAHLLGEDDKREAARTVLSDVLTLFANKAEAKLAKGIIDLAASRFDEAQAAFKDARKLLETVKAPPRRMAQAVGLLGMTLLEAGQLEPARVQLLESAKLDPYQADVWVSLADAEVRRGDRPAAFAAATKATELDPAYAYNWMVLGETALAVGRREVAKQALEKYLAMEKRESVAYVKGLLRTLR